MPELPPSEDEREESGQRPDDAEGSDATGSSEHTDGEAPTSEEPADTDTGLLNEDTGPIRLDPNQPDRGAPDHETPDQATIEASSESDDDETAATPSIADTQEVEARTGADSEGAPATVDELKAVVLARVRQTREQLLSLIDDFSAAERARFEEQRAREEEERELEQQRLEREREELEHEQERVRQEAIDQEAEAHSLRFQELESAHLAALETEHNRFAELEAAHAAALQTDNDRLNELEEAHKESRRAQDERFQQLERHAESLESDLEATRQRLADSTEGLGRLRSSFRRLDQAADQAEVLARLLEECTGYASRAALLLLPEDADDQADSGDELRVWAATGFARDASQEQVRLPAGWQQAIEGQTMLGRRELGDALVDQLGGEPSLDVLLVPFELRDRVRALLFCDRCQEEHGFLADALQLLCYAAAGALEVLPVRQSRPAGSLGDPLSSFVDDDSAEEPDVAATPESLDAEPVPAEQDEHDEHDDAEAPEPEAVAPAIDEPVPDEEDPYEEDREASAAAAKEAAQALLEADEAEDEGEEPGFELEDIDHVEQAEHVRDSDHRERFDTMPNLVAPSAAATQQLDVEEMRRQMDEDAAAEAEAEEEDEEEDEGATDGEPTDTVDVGAVLADQTATEEIVPPKLPSSWLPSADAPPPPPPVPQESPTSPPEPREDPAYTVEIPEPISEQDSDQVVEPEAEPTAEPQRRVGGEVLPPGDLDGPGWAFTAGDPSNAEEDSAHQEAKRLARLLVNELQLYNAEQIAEGRRRGDIYSFLKEDIEKSRHMYEERIDADVRESTNYFREELVKSLAGGDASLLGMPS